LEGNEYEVKHQADHSFAGCFEKNQGKEEKKEENIKISVGKFALKKSEIEIAEIKIKEAMEQNPLQTSLYFLNLEINKKNGNYILGLAKIEKLFTKTRSELYPKQQEIIFGGKNLCK